MTQKRNVPVFIKKLCSFNKRHPISDLTECLTKQQLIMKDGFLCFLKEHRTKDAIDLMTSVIILL